MHHLTAFLVVIFASTQGAHGAGLRKLSSYATPYKDEQLVANHTIVPSEAPSESPPTVQAQDEGDVRNKSHSGGDAASGRIFRIEINFDEHFKKNAWHLFTGSGSNKKEIYAEDFGKLQRGGTHVTTFEDMTAGVYTFIIADIQVDGIASEGVAVYQLIDGEYSLLWEESGNFGFLLENSFTIS